MLVVYLVLAVSVASFTFAFYMERRNDHPARRFERVQFIASVSEVMAALSAVVAAFVLCLTHFTDIDVWSTTVMPMVWCVALTWLLLADGFLLLQRNRQR